MNNLIREKLVRVAPFAITAFSIALVVHGLSIGHVLNLSQVIHFGDPGGNTGPNMIMRALGDPGGNTGPN
jgi:hypothetical protein